MNFLPSMSASTDAQRQQRSRRMALAVALVFAFAQPALADCGVDGTLVRDAATAGLTQANGNINQGAANVISASQARSKCIEHFGTSAIPPLGDGLMAIITQLSNNALESACQSAQGSATSYLSGAANQVTSGFPSSLPTLGSLGTFSPTGSAGNAVQSAVASSVPQPSTWSRMTCWVTGSC